MTQENSPVAENAPTIVVFDMHGKRIAQPTTAINIIEPETLLSNDTALGLSEQLKKIAEENRHAPAIGLKFAKFADGRSYSIAARLREAGYTGELHALGDINQELLFLLKRVGFTHAHIPDPGAERLAESVVSPFAGYYQAGQDGSKAPGQSTAH